MIDKVIIYTIVELDTSVLRGFSPGTYNARGGDVREMFSYNIHNVRLAYYPDSRIFRISGRLVNLSINPNRVDNLDVLWAGIEQQEYHQSLDDLINDFNRTLYGMTGTLLDIRTFNVSYIECCFNIRTACTNQYVEIFNRNFKRGHCMGRFRSYYNYVLENKLPMNTSFHIKINSDQKREGRIRSYAVNFYNKHNQLEQINRNAHGRQFAAHVTNEELQMAANILRLEVQCSTVYIKQVCRTRNVCRTLQSFLDIDMCSFVIRDKYRSFISKNASLDFYPYEQACGLINTSTLSQENRRNLRHYVLETLRGHTAHYDRRTHNRYNAMLERIGIHSYIMPISMGNEVLTSPMTLLSERLEQLRLSRQNYIERYGEQIPWSPNASNTYDTRPHEELEEFINDVEFEE